MPTKKTRKTAPRTSTTPKLQSKKVTATLEEVYAATGIKDPDENLEWLSDYTANATTQFLDEWGRENELSEIPEEVELAVREAIEEKAGQSWWNRYRAQLLEAIETAAQQAMSAVGPRSQRALDSPDEEKGVVSIIVQKPFLELWRAAVEGIGLSAWGRDEKLSDVKNLGMVISVLRDVAEVYGLHDFERLYQDAGDDRFEPETGNYWQISKIADAALKKVSK